MPDHPHMTEVSVQIQGGGASLAPSPFMGAQLYLLCTHQE